MCRKTKKTEKWGEKITFGTAVIAFWSDVAERMQRLLSCSFTRGTKGNLTLWNWCISITLLLLLIVVFSSFFPQRFPIPPLFFLFVCFFFVCYVFVLPLTARSTFSSVWRMFFWINSSGPGRCESWSLRESARRARFNIRWRSANDGSTFPVSAAFAKHQR